MSEMEFWNTLEGCRLKTEAMSNHMQRLDETSERFFEDKPQISTIVGEANSQRTKYILRVEDVIPYPAKEFGIILGDAVHCLRSALDHLIYGLARDKKNPGRSQFPICLTEKEWVTRAPAMYWSVPQGFVRLIDYAQPYHRGDMNAARAHPLAILMALSNLDKHRSIPAIALVSDEAEARIEGTQGIAQYSEVRFKPGARIEKGAVVAEAKIVPDNSGLQPHVYMEAHQTLAVGFGEIKAAPTISYKVVSDTMWEVWTFINDRVFDPIVEAWNTAVQTPDDAESD